MIYIFMLFLSLLSVAAPAFGSDRSVIPFEQTQEGKVALPLIVDMLSDQPSNKDEICFYVTPWLPNPLCYAGKKHIDLLRQNYGMECQTNEPCVRIFYPNYHPSYHKDTQSLKKQFIDPLTAIPLRYFIVGHAIEKENNVFKGPHNTVCSFMAQDGDSNKFVCIQLNEDLKVTMGCGTDDAVLTVLLKRFDKDPCPWFLRREDQEVLQEELLADGILAQGDEEIAPNVYSEKLIHGPNGYSSLSEYKSIQKSPSYFSYFKNPYFCLIGVGGLIAIYVWCKKFYK
jgi:hypothetical protein